MNTQQCLQMLREIKDTAFATVDENGFPQIRMIDIMLTENKKLYFCTARGKDFYHQLMRDGHVAITAMNRNYQMIRVTGIAEKLSEQKYWIDYIFEENTSMNSVYPNESRYILEPFCIANAQIEFFDLGQTPIYRESFGIGNWNAAEKGFVITDSCIGCGKCKRNCPQQCITDGKPYSIEQNHCLHCGLCFEKCPANAIKKECVS